MKYMIMIAIMSTSFIFAQSGIGIYGGLHYGGSSNWDFDTLEDLDLVGQGFDLTFKSALTMNFTVGASMMVGPLKIGAGFSPRTIDLTQRLEEDHCHFEESTETYSWNYLEFWAVYPHEMVLGSVNLNLFGGFMAGMAVGDGTADISYSSYLNENSIDAFTSGTLQASECADDAEDCMEMHTNVDYGLLFGVGYSINDDISINTGYYMGLAEIVDWESHSGYDDLDDDTQNELNNGKYNSLFATFTYKF